MTTPTKTTHTPTPWTTESIVPENQMGRDVFLVPFDNSEDWIAKMAGHGSSKADAEFILLAVNNHEKLVEALESIVKEASRHDFGMSLQIQRARSVLASLSDGQEKPA